jgi:ABC-type transporter Mla subunit MlaD
MSLRAIAAAADYLAALLEASTPKGLKHRRHAQHVAPARRRIKRVMAHYFARQGRAVLAEVKPHLARALLLHPIVREASTTGKTFARSLVPASLQPLSFAATSVEASEYDSVIGDLVKAAAKSLGSAEGADLAGGYLRDNSLAKLTGGINATSIDRLQDALADAWDAGGDYNSMVKAVTSTFEDFSDRRADLIAQTETADAYNAGRSETAAALGYGEKSWETESGDPCPECVANEAQGWIPMDEDFQSGDDAPTAHPNCLCVVNFRKADDEEE